MRPFSPSPSSLFHSADACRRRGAYQSYINVTYGVGSALGAALGGAMAEALGWRWEFGVQIPPLVLCIGVAAIAIPAELGIAEERKGVWQALREFDAKGSLLLTAAICFLILGLVCCLPRQVSRDLMREPTDISAHRVSVATSCRVSAPSPSKPSRPS